MTTRAENLKVWTALVVAAVSAAIVAVIMSVSLDAGPAVAATATDATIVATTLTLDPDSSGTGTLGEAFAVCPGTKRAVGGGVVQSGSAEGLGVHLSGPLDNTGVTSQTVTGDKAKQWYAAVSNSTSGQRSYKVFAICSGDSTAKIKATPFSLDSGTNGEAFAKCPRTKRALGGGVVQSGSPDYIALLASGPLDRTGVTLNTVTGDKAKQWYAAVFNDSGALREFKVFAICE